MFIHEFRDKLVSALSSTSIPKKIRTEKDFEMRFLIPVVMQILAQERDLHIYSHPWNSRTRCQPDCKTAREHRQTVVGCLRCWAESKKWASVLAFGTHHTFDLVAKDASEKHLRSRSNSWLLKVVACLTGRFKGLWGSVPLPKPNTITLLGYVAIEEASIRDGTPTLRQSEFGMSGQGSVLYFGLLVDFVCLKPNPFVTWTNLYFHRRRVNARW
jgi:hypothetical protein